MATAGLVINFSRVGKGAHFSDITVFDQMPIVGTIVFVYA